MFQHTLRFGLLGVALLLLLLLSDYAVLSPARPITWLLVVAGALFVVLGAYLGRLVGSSKPRSPVPTDTVGFPRAERLSISEREYEVLQLVAQGLSNREIGERLFIAESTVKTHVSSLLTKLGAKRRTQAVRKARQQRILR